MVKKHTARKSFRKRNGLLIASVAGVPLLVAAGAVLVMHNSPPADTPPAGAIPVTVYKRAGCHCCDLWVRHLQKAGLRVTVEQRTDLEANRARLGVSASYAACHTAVVRGYVIEGHVPASDIQRLLTEQPVARGLALPGMPEGSPGMEGPHPQPYDVILLHQDGTSTVFARHDPQEHD